MYFTLPSFILLDNRLEEFLYDNMYIESKWLFVVMNLLPSLLITMQSLIFVTFLKIILFFCIFLWYSVKCFVFTFLLMGLSLTAQHCESLLYLRIEGLLMLEHVKDLGVVNFKQHTGNLTGFSWINSFY